MAWEPHQQYRLAMEHRILKERLPDFVFKDPRGDTSVEGWWQSSRENWYRIVIDIPPGFPDECPNCYIAEPSPLRGVFQDLSTYGNSHKMHLWEATEAHPTWTRICTYRPAAWSASHSIEKVIHKAMLWIEAFESHLETGKPIADFLMDM